MAAPLLPAECLNQILLECHANKVPLYNYLFVSRLWCECVLYFIWLKPFERKINITFQEKRSEQLIRTLITCLPYDSKKLLQENGIQLPNNHLESKTLFNYQDFIRKLDPQLVGWATREWISKSSTTLTIDEDALNRKNYILSKEILKLLIRGKKLTSKFVLSQRSIKYDDNTQMPIHELLPNAQDYMTKIRSLVCNYPNKIPVATFNSLSQSATDIEVFNLSLYDENNDLIQLIRTQRGIKKLKLVSDRLNSKFDEALKEHTEKITYVKCTETLSISPDTLTQCQNLKDLILYCKIPKDTFVVLGNAQYPKLQKLDLKLNNLDLERLSRIIKTTKGQMEVLKLQWSTYDPENTSSLIKAIGDHYPRIVELMIPIRSEDASGLAYLFSKCHHVRSIMLISKVNIVQDGDQLVTAIADNSSKSLRSCSIHGCWKYTPKVWQMFCERQSNSSPIRISLTDRVSGSLSPEIISILRHYDELGCIIYDDLQK
ncbi:1727_t:CDS:1 [Ambispora leptoticha]|uniref:1727_t:CDS:1 n=1 Tax=Ambispora leptoticha TaxID=144679 RepID=A0A9N9HC35_9GLOM|nr:1727_t:CDS:1 [Ambispora leptoticha]